MGAETKARWSRGRSLVHKFHCLQLSVLLGMPVGRGPISRRARMRVPCAVAVVTPHSALRPHGTAGG